MTTTTFETAKMAKEKEKLNTDFINNLTKYHSHELETRVIDLSDNSKNLSRFDLERIIGQSDLKAINLQVKELYISAAKKNVEDAKKIFEAL